MTTSHNPSPDMLRLILDRAPDIIYRYCVAPGQGYDFISEAVTRITGYTPAEYYADPELGRKLAHPDDRAVLTELLRIHWRPGPHVVRSRHKDGELIWLDHHTVPIYNDANELTAIEGVARQISDPTVGPAATIRMSGRVRIDLLDRLAVVGGREVSLTPAEFKLLALLAERPGRIVTRTQMMRHLWRSSHVGGGHTCEAHISNLRRKIEVDPRNPMVILTVRGHGYRLAVDDAL